jgi:hypothetical protein
MAPTGWATLAAFLAGIDARAAVIGGELDDVTARLVSR